ncbi:glycosyltransferase family 4 protein [Thermosediminibacter litoriperuensis]|uniref:UDP-GlcNAc:undecaprenyl-phosphate GlcNAc-1-phosphate transferase n=1 Tax=Thermosediminibacter litoriperuensis TaxID=291989 RepID=A0A5S5AZS6_9FIRM|nr:MraY family glycosyltransferase [Thermosediminibacter litoriperuensis]TYP58765.1 UDP-GlcNAc:undecaprenyl-phosphate GlcNAc-1-phosphate transferase [Thermosediminibacter litoriperuensis]
MPLYIYAFFMAMAVAYLATPSVMKLAWKVGAVDVPRDARRIHKKPMPRLGGLAIFIAFTAVGLVTLPLQYSSMRGMLLGGAFIAAVGVLDDIYGLPAKVKLLFQTAAAFILVQFGLKIVWVTNPLGGMFFLGKWSIPVTLFWVVGITNTLNFIDGLDGLAAGIAAIASVTMMLVNISLGQVNATLVTALLAGAALGFLPYNFNPAKIFMGDTGAMFLGYILAAVAVDGAVKSATAIALIVPILALGLPIFDTAFAIVRRFLKGKPIMQADRGHIHHRLLDVGFSQKQAVVYMYLLSLALGFCALMLIWVGVKQAFLALAALLAAFIVAGRQMAGSQDKKSQEL